MDVPSTHMERAPNTLPAEEAGGVASALPPPPSLSSSCLKAAGGRASLHSAMWTRVDMTAVGELVLVLGLLVSAHCEVRARDPEVEEEEEERGGRAAAGAGGAAFSPHLESLHPGVTGTPPQADRGNHPARTG